MAKKSKFDIKDVFPRIGKFLKGFPKNIKPMVKDPVTNMEQLNERRREVSGMLYFFILFAVVMAILCCLPVVGDIASMLTILPVLGLMFSGFLMDMDGVGMTILFPYAAVFAGLAFVTMLLVKHGDAKPQAKKGLEAMDVDD